MRFRTRVTALFWTIAPTVLADSPVIYSDHQLTVNTLGGGKYEFWPIIGRIIAYLTGAIGAIAITMFVVGALFVTLSGVKEEWRQKGKDLMIGSILSLAVVLGAYAILRMLELFLTT